MPTFTEYSLGGPLLNLCTKNICWKRIYITKVRKAAKYPGDTRPVFKMWGGASKSVFVLVLKICQHQFASRTLSC